MTRPERRLESLAVAMIALASFGAGLVLGNGMEPLFQKRSVVEIEIAVPAEGARR